MKLQSMTDRVLQLAELRYSDINDNEYIEKSINHANFLKQPLTLGMFIPTDENGNVLEMPMSYKKYYNNSGAMAGSDILLCEQFQQAKDRVIFEGFEKCKRLESIKCVVNEKLDLHLSYPFNEKETIEDLVEYNLTITETAVKKHGL